MDVNTNTWKTNTSTYAELSSWRKINKNKTKKQQQQEIIFFKSITILAEYFSTYVLQ